MSRRKRYPSKTKLLPAQPGYPSPEGRRRIIEQRDELLQKLIFLFVSGASPDDARLAKLVQEYGAQEVQRVTEVFQKQARRRDFLVDEPGIYRDYRWSFARFGGSRRFLVKSEYEQLSLEHARLFGLRKFKGLLHIPAQRKREQELDDLLLKGWPYWEDITPLVTPLRPADFTALPPAEYRGPERDLLSWGWDLDLQRVQAQAANPARWRPATPDLERMVFDEGLLDGWPGEAASWAPYYALHLLGVLGASQYAASMISLAGRRNDWLSDVLPGVWAQMGLTVEPVLWKLLDDESLTTEPRGLAAAGLSSLAQAHPGRRSAVVEGMAQRLIAPPPGNAVVNAYIIFLLNRMQAVEARQAIEAAFEQGKVALDIMGPEDVSFGN